MDQEKFGKFIKELRKNNNLTQKQLSDKYNVSYQAVSKWENGKNMPDMSLIKQISKDFNISLDEMFDCNINEKNIEKNSKKNLIIIISICISLVIILLMIIFYYKTIDFEFKTLSSKCENFNISGSISYNSKKSSIYITNIKYCGVPNKEKYVEIECILYESNKDIEKKISTFSYQEEENITLEEFLETVTLSVDDYKKTCKEYSQNSLYLKVNAKDLSGKITTYKIPLALDESCSN